MRHPMWLDIGVWGALVLASSCGQDLSVNRVVRLGPDCEVPTPAKPGDAIDAGVLDVIAGAPEFFAGVELLRHPRALLPDGTYESAGARERASGRLLISELRFSYAAIPNVPGLKPRSVPVAVEMDPAWNAATIPVELLGPEVRRVLESLGPDDRVDLRVSITAVATGDSSIVTQPFVFPISVMRGTQPTCAYWGYVRHHGSCRYAGQAVAPEQPVATCCFSSLGCS